MTRTLFRILAAIILTVLSAGWTTDALAYSQGSYYGQGYYQGGYISGSGGAVRTHAVLYTYTGSTQVFKVPDTITQLRVVVVGGGGGGGGGAAGWGSGAGGGCGGAVSASGVTVTPGQKITLYVGGGGAGGPTDAYNGITGQTSYFGAMTAVGGSWGRNGYYNLYGNWYTGGSGGGSGSGGGGNGYPGFYAVPGSGGRAGNKGSSLGAGGSCTGGTWPAYF